VEDDQRDPDTGQYTPQFTDEQLLEFLDENEPVGTRAVAKEFECSQPAAYKRLAQLEKKDAIESQLIGGSRIWTIQ